MQGTAHDSVHALELFRGAELNFPEPNTHGNDYLNKYLVVQIFDETVSIVFAFLSLQRFDPVGVEHRQQDRNQKNDDQPGKCKILNQAKRLDSLFRLFGFHRKCSRYKY